jgi:hypothetical protein
VIIEVPANTTMVQRGDLVDVMCSLSNEKPVFGPAGSSATAVLAKARKVIARFHTTATAGRPPAGDMWPYTLEVEPWQAAAIELARKIGGQFSLAVSASDAHASDVTGPGGAVSTAPENDVYKAAEERYAATNRFTVSDLAALFGVEEPEPESLFRLERLVGNKSIGTLEYRLPNGGAKPTSGKDGKGGTKPAGSSGTKMSSSGTDSRTVASSSGSKPAADLGFHEVGYDPNKCKTCGKKK